MLIFPKIKSHTNTFSFYGIRVFHINWEGWKDITEWSLIKRWKKNKDMQDNHLDGSRTQILSLEEWEFNIRCWLAYINLTYFLDRCYLRLTHWRGPFLKRIFFLWLFHIYQKKMMQRCANFSLQIHKISHYLSYLMLYPKLHCKCAFFWYFSYFRCYSPV